MAGFEASVFRKSSVENLPNKTETNLTSLLQFWSIYRAINAVSWAYRNNARSRSRLKAKILNNNNCGCLC